MRCRGGDEAKRRWHLKWSGQEHTLLGPGWQLQYHGTDVYGASHAMCCGELFPSKKETRGSGTACGRGVYTTETLRDGASFPG